MTSTTPQSSSVGFASYNVTISPPSIVTHSSSCSLLPPSGDDVDDSRTHLVLARGRRIEVYDFGTTPPAQTPMKVGSKSGTSDDSNNSDNNDNRGSSGDGTWRRTHTIASDCCSSRSEWKEILRKLSPSTVTEDEGTMESEEDDSPKLSLLLSTNLNGKISSLITFPAPPSTAPKSRSVGVAAAGDEDDDDEDENEESSPDPPRDLIFILTEELSYAVLGLAQTEGVNGGGMAYCFKTYGSGR